MQAGGPIGLLLCSLSESGCTIDQQFNVHDGMRAVDILNMPYQRLKPWALELYMRTHVSSAVRSE
eukprot:13369810-Alexandrium_andersonii.AAC.1